MTGEETKIENASEETLAEEDFQSNYDTQYSSFVDMGLKKDLLAGVYAMGWLEPSKIQSLAVVPILKGRDVLAQAQSGMGKTGAFCIGVLQMVDVDNRNVQYILLSPTRELARQTNIVMSKLSEHLGVKTHLCIGGTRTVDDIDAIRNGVHIVIGTPGRIRDILVERKAINSQYVRGVVIDECDEMISRGFQDTVVDIIGALKKDAQLIFMSATVSNLLIKVCKNIMKDAIRMLITREEVTLEGITQYYLMVKDDIDKVEKLSLLYEEANVTQSIIYCRTTGSVDSLADAMRKLDHVVAAIHGDMDMEERNRIMREFRSGESRVLISTDLLSRGIDVQQISMVINFDLPRDKETYIHRIGRSGRYGRKGFAINFVTADDLEKLTEIRTFYQTEIKELPHNFKDHLRLFRPDK